MADIFFWLIMVLTISTINVRSINSAWRRRAVFDELKNLDVDVFCLQECCVEYDPEQSEWGFGSCVWSPLCESRNEGVGVLCKNKDIKILSYECIVPGRLLLCHMEHQGTKFRLFNVYAHANKNERKELLNLLRIHLVGRTPTIVAGDFNLIRFVKDREGIGEQKLDVTSKNFNEIVTDFKLKDVVVEVGGEEDAFSYFSDKGTCKSRIDYILVTGSVKIHRCKSYKVSFSDHVALSCRVEVDQQTAFGKGVWKLNTLLLQDPEVYNEFAVFFEKLVAKKKNFNNVLSWWDEVKKQMAEFFKKIGMRKARERREENVKTVKQLHFLYKCKRLGMEVDEEIQQVREKRNEELKRKGKEILFKAKIKDMEEGEKCTRYFFKKVLSPKSTMAAVLVEGKVETGTKIEETVKDFYTDLYSGKEEAKMSEIKEYCQVLEDALNPEDKEMLDCEITEPELLDAVKSMQRNKTPGRDGLPVEFFEFGWTVLGKHFLEVLKYCRQNNCISQSMKEGLITLIFKKKGDRREIKNWRPITLLNSDYKIYAKIFANRMRQVIGKMVGEWQTCAVPGRRMSDGLIMLRDLISHLQSNNEALTVAGIDLEKAYDKVSHKFLFSCLLSLGIPSTVVNTLRSLYTGITSQILVNGRLSPTVDILSGVRQGCPLSPILFICVVEPLLRYVQTDKVMKGFFLPGGDGTKIKSLCYMDDMGFLCGNQSDMNRVDLLLRLFSNVSGLKVNWQKSQLCNLSGMDNVRSEKIPKTESITVLGVHFERNLVNTVNAEKALEKIQKKIEFWKLRRLTFTGKVLISKAVLLPLMLFFSVVFPPNNAWCKRFEMHMCRFFWGSKMERVRREIIKKECKNGGYNVPDLRIFLDMHYWLNCFKIFSSGNRTAKMMKYLAGWEMTKWGWCKIDLTKPKAFIVPIFYLKLKSFFEKNKLNQMDDGSTDKVKLLRWLRKDEMVCNIFNFPSKVAQGVWSKMSWGGVSNRQKEIAWQTFHECLMTKYFLKSRDLSREEMCPRDGCASMETVYHVFWDCKFVTKLRRKLDPFFKEVLGVGLNSLEIWMFGEIKGCKRTQRRVWVFSCIMKEVIWDARCLYVRKNVRLTADDCANLCLAKLHVVYLWDVKLMGAEEASDFWRRSRWKV